MGESNYQDLEKVHQEVYETLKEEGKDLPVKYEIVDGKLSIYFEKTLGEKNLGRWNNIDWKINTPEEE